MMMDRLEFTHQANRARLAQTMQNRNGNQRLPYIVNTPYRNRHNMGSMNNPSEDIGAANIRAFIAPNNGNSFIIVSSNGAQNDSRASLLLSLMNANANFRSINNGNHFPTAIPIEEQRNDPFPEIKTIDLQRDEESPIQREGLGNESVQDVQGRQQAKPYAPVFMNQGGDNNGNDGNNDDT